MRKNGLVLAIIAALGGPAMASDAYHDGHKNTWTGAQLGVLYGYSWMKDYNNTLRLEAEGDGDVIGLFAAYNHQFGNFAAGAEVNYVSYDNMFTDGSGVVVKDLFAAKLRGGYAHDRFFVYGMAGVVHGRTNLAGDDWGLVVGAGVDVALTEHLIAGLQYNYYDFVNFNHTTIDAQLHEVSGRVGVKF